MKTPPVLEVPLDRILHDWRGALARVGAYARALGLAPDAARGLSRRAVERALGSEPGDGATGAALDAAAQILLEDHPPSDVSAGESGRAAFAQWRLALWQRGLPPPGGRAEARPVCPTPPLLRGSMVPEHFRGRRLGQWRRSPGESTTEARDPNRRDRRLARAAWSWRGRRRRALLVLLVLIPSCAAGLALLASFPAHIYPPVEITLAVFFGALFGWISVGFWTALFGFVVLLRGGDRFAIHRGADAPLPPLDPSARTALVMPICDEPVERVFAGLRAMRASLERVGAREAFDIYVASDSTDPDVWIDEEEAWARWRREDPAAGGVFYRRRRVRRKRKSGNVADFCRRFGRRYRYMVVLDADSVMSGECLVRLVGLMESHPDVGIIQTAPTVVRAHSLFARLQQFTSRLYGPMFAAGMHYWQLGDSPYWGHNAILRVEPFMRHCGLPRLSGRPPLGGEILSHDFVEAALLGRADWSIWLAFGLGGSWEETPGSLLEEMQRDRRWCQGNLQHLRLLFTEGLASVHRALFLNGIFSYVSAVLWLGFLAASTAEAALWTLLGPDYFPAGPSLFPTWPVWRPGRVVALFAVVFVVLLLPKFLAVVLAWRNREVAGFGGFGALLRSVLFEAVSSALFAPIRMVFYCRFVLLNLLGWAVAWRGGADAQEETTWLEALRRHGPDTLVACCWLIGVRLLHPEAFWWLIPVAGALVLSVPLSVLASRRSLGVRTRTAGWFVTPEESAPPREIAELEARLEAGLAARRDRLAGFQRAVVDPLVNALHAALLRGPRSRTTGLRAERRVLADRALDAGPDALGSAERRVLLSDAASLLDLHERVWRLEDGDAAARWGLSPAAPG